MNRRAVLAVVLLVTAGCSSAHHRAAATSTSSPPTTAASTTTTVAAATTTTTPMSTTTMSTTTMATATTTATTAARSTSTTAVTVSPARPCTGAAPRAYQHVVWILFENRASSEVENSTSAPYFAHLASECGMGTDYSGISHPSLPNYIALTSGGLQGVNNDADPSTWPLDVPSIFSVLGSGWRALEESIPSDCAQTSSGNYAVRHNPAAYYTNIRAACMVQDVGLGPVPDLSARFTFITPNLCDDMHNCSTQTGDTWLSHEMPLILATPQYSSGSTVVVVTFDENDSGGTLVPLYVIAPSVHPGARSGQPFNHYSLLRTTEELLGLHPLLGHAATATSMKSAFNL